MKYLLLVVALVAVGCSGKDSPTAPSSLPATLVSTGSLTTAGCFVSATPTLANCLVFDGTVQNTGPGCASGVRGVVTTYTLAENRQIGSAPWTYTGPVVRANETIAFSGGPLTIGVPLTGSWVYRNAITFDSVRC